MINRSLPRLPWSSVRSKLNQCECFSLCLLARYPQNGVSARPLQSFQRAWGMNILKRVAVVPGGRPGYVVAIWNTGAFTRVTVAIEGMRTIAQLHATWVGYNSTAIGSEGARVFHAYNTFANTIYTELLADPDVAAALAARNVGFTFTGFSLGAAIAEVLSNLFILNHSNPSYQLSKWASPKVGNAAWVNRTQLPADRCSFYTNEDPIWIYPYMTLHQLDTRSAPWSQGFTSFAANNPEQYYNMQGLASFQSRVDTLVVYLRYSASTNSPITPTNPWYFHASEAYRLMLFNDCENGGLAGLEAHYRFRFLEYEFDNNWWENYTTGQETWDGLDQVSVPPPPDFAVPEEPALDERRGIMAGSHTVPQVPVVTGQDNTNRLPVPAAAWMPRRTRDL